MSKKKRPEIPDPPPHLLSLAATGAQTRSVLNALSSAYRVVIKCLSGSAPPPPMGPVSCRPRSLQTDYPMMPHGALLCAGSVYHKRMMKSNDACLPIWHCRPVGGGLYFRMLPTSSLTT